MTDDLSTRLLAKIAEREKAAQDAVAESRMRDWPEGVPDWFQSDSGNVYYEGTNAIVATGSWGDLAEQAGRHIALNDPRFALRLCQAHREIVAEYTGALFTQSCHPDYEDNNGFVIGLSRVITHLAHGYGIEA